jgi:hypothetical protein
MRDASTKFLDIRTEALVDSKVCCDHLWQSGL